MGFDFFFYNDILCPEVDYAMVPIMILRINKIIISVLYLSLILFSGCIPFSYETESITISGERIDADGKIDNGSYEDSLMHNFLTRIHAENYWQYAKNFPEVEEDSEYKTYPQMIQAYLVKLDTSQKEYEAGMIGLPPILDLEIQIMRRMLYARELPDAMRNHLVMEIYRRYRQILSFEEAAFTAGSASGEQVEAVRKNLNLFMEQHNINE